MYNKSLLGDSSGDGWQHMSAAHDYGTLKAKVE